MMNKTAAPANSAPANASGSGRKPVHTIRLGAIKAAIWENTVGDGAIRHGVTFCRLYRDGEQWKTSDSYGRDDLLMLAKVADRAHTWICDLPRPA